MYQKQSAKFFSGSLPNEIFTKIENLLEEFLEFVKYEAHARQLRSAIVRSMLTCSITIILDEKTLWIVAQKQNGMPVFNRIDCRQNTFSKEQIFTAAKLDFGFDDPFIIPFSTSLLEQTTEERKNTLEAIAKSHVESEFQRMNAEMNTIQINPIFGPAQYQVDARLAFVLMPFTEPLTDIYSKIIKPTIEQTRFNLVCKRADDIKSNRAIIQDIWKSICEARIIIADMTNLNPNVMYELGIAHTLGKETILLYQNTSTEINFPFDLSHIRRIEYENSATGGKELEKRLTDTLETVLDFRLIE